ncbi:kinase-like protein [Periconia macrospinosa]|uniref:non-specific serine/threonine protein kinase n=1 Tax=Periconia macrospinosa TaxID=97972 RepID=A0A2V1E0U9_9PLEO|nr:kinase-like protein [Periconia macrospinosa]
MDSGGSTARWRQTILESWIQTPANTDNDSSSTPANARLGPRDTDYVWVNPNVNEHHLHLPFRPRSPPSNPKSLTDIQQETTSDDGSTAFQTASKGTGTFLSAPEVASVASNGSVRISPRHNLSADNEHVARARRMGLLKPREQELDWSGFGQHAQFTHEREVPLQPLFEIARSARSIVDAVQCRRIKLARKRILCHRRYTPEEALAEVRHVQLFRNRHIVQCIGTYSIGKWIGILTYPVAYCNLLDFLQETATLHEYDEAAMYNRQVLVKSFVFNMRGSETRTIRYVNVYITDFGISRHIVDLEHSQTDGPTGWTEMYCSPEVAKYEARGRASDMFSLGCVFAEMATVIANRKLEEFCHFRSDDGCAFHLNLPLVCKWIMALRDAAIYWDNMWEPTLRDTIIGLLGEDPDTRPTASDLKLLLGTNPCCSLPQESIKSS